MAENKKNHSLIELYDNKLVFSKVENMLNEAQPFNYILQYLDTKDMSISKSSLSNLKSKLEESKTSGIPLENLLDKRRKTGLNKVTKITGYTGNPPINDSTTGEIMSQNNGELAKTVDSKIWSDSQVLDEIIGKSMKAIDSAPYLDVSYGLKALELKNKLFGKDTKGLTISALQQYQVIIEAKIKAMNDAIMKYIPEDEQEQVYNDMDKAEQEVLNQVEITEEGKNLIKVLKNAGLDI